MTVNVWARERAVLAGVVTLMSSIALTLVSAWLITRAWQMPPVMNLTVAITSVRALGISRAVFRYIYRLATHDVALTAAANARSQIYHNLVAVPPSTVLGMSRGRLLSFIGPDIDALTDKIVRATIPRRVAIYTGILAIALTATLSLLVAGILAIGLGFAGIVVPWIAVQGEKKASTAQATEDYVSAVDHVLHHAAALSVRGELDQVLQHADDAEQRISSIRGWAHPWSSVSTAMSAAASGFTLIIVVLVAVLASPDHSPQWLAAVALMPLVAFEAVAPLAEASRAVVRSRDAEQRLRNVLTIDNDTEQTTSNDVSDENPVFAVRETSPAVGKKMSSGRVTANHLVVGWDHPAWEANFDVPPGGRYEIVAPSGTGKTTLLMTLAGLIPAWGGKYSAVGARFIAEDEHIFATTVRDNLAVGAADASESAMREMIDRVGLAQWVEHLPRGLDTVLRDGEESLSGGQRRRLIVARALLSDAPILLIDEPTEHVDKDSEKRLLDVLGFGDSVAGSTDDQRTIVMVRHPRSP